MYVPTVDFRFGRNDNIYGIIYKSNHKVWRVFRMDAGSNSIAERKYMMKLRIYICNLYRDETDWPISMKNIRYVLHYISNIDNDIKN